MPNELARFRLINVKLYYNEEGKHNNVENELLDNEFGT